MPLSGERVCCPPRLGKSLDELVAVSLSHKHAPLDAVGLYENRIVEAYDKLAAYTSEIVVLATCNRFEVYAVASSPRFIEKTWEFLGPHRVYTQTYTGLDAARHLFRVASGLESAIIGENEILGQVAKAYEYARSQGYAGKYMATLFHHAIKTGKLARAKTMINYGHIGAPGAAVHSAEKLIGGFNNSTVLVVGAGKAGSIIARLVREKSPTAQIIILNRTYEKALNLARKVRGKAYTLDALGDLIQEADVVFVAVSAGEPVVKQAHLNRLRQGAVVVDISNPPAVEHPVPGHIGYIGLTGVEKVMKDAIERRLQEVSKVEAIIEEQLKIFETAWKRRAADEAAALFMNYAEHTIREELEELLARLKPAIDKNNSEVREVLKDFTWSLTKKLLRPLILYAHETAVNESPETLEKLVEKFRIELEKRIGRH